MALQGTIPELRQTSLAQPSTAGRDADRARSFARARRHTLLVRFLRVALPALAVVSLASYGVGVRKSFRVSGGKLDTSGIAISTQNLTMSNPRYEGFNKDGSKFTVAAKTAVQDIRQQGPIELNHIDSKIVQANESVITMTAPRGLFDTKTNQLELFDDIKIRGDGGMRADLTHAMIYTKESRVVSKQPVAIDMAAGQIRANEMELLQTARQVTFSDGVATRLRPEPKPASASTPARQPASPGQPRMIGTSDSPVDVASRKLLVDDNRKVAIFTGDVVARQGEATLRAPALHAYYEGAPVSTPGAAPAAPGAAATGKLKRLFVPSDVDLVQGTDHVSSDSADFDALRETAVLVGHVDIRSGTDRHVVSDRADLDSRADTALLTGNVVVTQDRNMLRGNRLHIDRKAGSTKLSTPVDAGQPAGRIAARFFQSAAAAQQGPAKQAQPANPASGFVFRTDPNAPIDIDAETLEVVDKAKTATFRGAVRAVQGEFTIKTPELVASYSGDAGLASTGDGKQPSAQLTRIRANQHVEVTSTNDQSATGDWADFNVKANTVTIGGNVAMKKGKSFAYAQKAIIDMTTGVTYLENDNKGQGPAVSLSPTEQRAPYALPDLPAKKEPIRPPTPPAFATDPRACPPGRQCLQIDPSDGVGVRSSGKPGAANTATPAWKTQPAPPAKPQKPAAETSGWTSGQPSAN